jgi:hypothetical protein
MVPATACLRHLEMAHKWPERPNLGLTGSLCQPAIDPPNLPEGLPEMAHKWPKRPMRCSLAGLVALDDHHHHHHHDCSDRRNQDTTLYSMLLLLVLIMMMQAANVAMAIMPMIIRVVGGMAACWPSSSPSALGCWST